MRYVNSDKMIKLSKLMIPILILTLLISGFSGCSGTAREAAAMDGSTGRRDQADGDGTVDYVYGIPMDENAAVITESVADVYSSPDVKSNRVTQAIYNQPVSILQQEQGWAKVSAVDGSTGWMKLKYIDHDVSSIYGRTFTHRIIVTSREKVISSNLSGGITMMNAPMGTELFAFNDSSDAYEVFLPGNQTGWIKGSGIIQVDIKDKTPVTNAEDFAATALRLKGTGYLLNGISGMGIDAPGLVYICGRINGIGLPRSINGQLETGTEIKPEDVQVGDLLFISGTGEGEGKTVNCVGICIGNGSYIYAGRSIGYVAISDVNKENAEGRVIAARRIFN